MQKSKCTGPVCILTFAFLTLGGIKHFSILSF